MTKTWILGPCSLENEEMYIDIGTKLSKIMRGKNWFYKASFDKANRSSVDGKRGIGLEKSIDIFKKIKKTFPDIKLTTDVHEVWQVERLSEIIDVIQIPAFLCRQTDLLVECAKFFDFVNIKKGQWMSPHNMVKGVDKIKSTNPNAEAWITERGTQFGYTQLIVDFGGVEILRRHFDKVILDATHSTQRLKPNGRTGGDSSLAEKYILVADIFKFDGVFAETHQNPSQAFSDGDSQIKLDKLAEIINKSEKINNIVNIYYNYER